MRNSQNNHMHDADDAVDDAYFCCAFVGIASRWFRWGQSGPSRFFLGACVLVMWLPSQRIAVNLYNAGS